MPLSLEFHAVKSFLSTEWDRDTFEQQISKMPCVYRLSASRPSVQKVCKNGTPWTVENQLSYFPRFVSRE